MSNEDTRARIVRTAAVHFARQGFEGASLRKIAEDVGIKAASIFHHFPGGKAELYEAITHEIAETIRVHVVARYGVSAGLSPVDSIVQMAAAFWDYFAEHPTYATIILQQSTGMDRDFARFLEDAAIGIVQIARDFMVEAQARGELADFDLPHFMLWTTAHTLTVHGAPFLASYVVPSDPTGSLRTHYLAMVRAQIAPPRRKRPGTSR